MGQTVNLLSFDFGGSNPSLPTFLRLERSLVFCGSSSVDRALAFQAEGRGFEPRLPLLERIDNQKVINPFLLYEFFAPLSLYYKLCNCWSIVVPPKNNRYDNNQSRSIKRQTKE